MQISHRQSNTHKIAVLSSSVLFCSPSEESESDFDDQSQPRSLNTCHSKDHPSKKPRVIREKFAAHAPGIASHARD